jgi:hypothetical protein
MYIFADATNVEFADAYTGSLLLPPERLTTPLFKSIAKSKGPFVTLVQYGFSTPNYQGEGQAAKDEQHSRRFLSVMDWVYGAGLSAYDFTTLMARRLAKKLNIHRASSEIGIRNTRIYYYNTSRVETNLVLITPERHFWHMQEPGDE